MQTIISNTTAICVTSCKVPHCRPREIGVSKSNNDPLDPCNTKDCSYDCSAKHLNFQDRTSYNGNISCFLAHLEV